MPRGYAAVQLGRIPMASPDPAASFIARWSKAEASARANYVLFLSELCDLLEVPRPDPVGPDTAQNAYVFERAIHDDALNAARAAEEAKGHIRWLRPEYQQPLFAGTAPSKPRAGAKAPWPKPIATAPRRRKPRSTPPGTRRPLRTLRSNSPARTKKTCRKSSKPSPSSAAPTPATPRARRCGEHLSFTTAGLSSHRRYCNPTAGAFGRQFSRVGDAHMREIETPRPLPKN